MATANKNDIFADVDRLLGRTRDDREFQGFLATLGYWPLGEMGPEDLSMFIENRGLGYCLVLENCSTVPHPLAAGKPDDMLIFAGCFFYPEGEEGYHSYVGRLPADISWSDTSESLTARLGTPKNVITNKKTGNLTAHRWPLGQWLLTASYRGGGKELKRIYVGIY